jgi:2-dehydropantoate 2-reductase
MRVAIVGSGAVGGYFGAKLARAGHEVTFLARGAHLAAIRERGLTVRSTTGECAEFTVRAAATDRARDVPAPDLAIFAVKAYSNAEALPLLAGVARDRALVLTLQNGIDSVDEVSGFVDRDQVLGGSTYVATALAAPGLVEQTGTHQRIVFGEVDRRAGHVSERVERVHQAFAGADIDSEPVADARVPIWEKFCYLAPFAAFTGAARLPIGGLWTDPAIRQTMVAAFEEVAAVGRGEGVLLPEELVDRISKYVDSIPATTRSSLLIDLQQGKPIEVEALVGAVVRRASRLGLAAPIMSALYAVLKPHANGTSRSQA